MKPIINILASILLLTVMTNAADPKFEPNTGKSKIPYLLYTPKTESGKKYPLVLFLHGAGERGNDNSAQLKHGAPAFITPENQAKNPCFVIAPQCPKDQWWPGENLDNVIDIFKKLARDPRIDTDRLYITGLSMGGFGTWDALEKNPRLFAAAIPICGGGNPKAAKLFKRVPIRIYHGDADDVIKLNESQSMIDALDKAKATDAKLTIYPGVGHNSWTQTYNNPEVMTWLFSQSK